jgi:hypothetical protein
MDSELSSFFSALRVQFDLIVNQIFRTQRLIGHMRSPTHSHRHGAEHTRKPLAWGEQPASLASTSRAKWQLAGFYGLATRFVTNCCCTASECNFPNPLSNPWRKLRITWIAVSLPASVLTIA